MHINYFKSNAGQIPRMIALLLNLREQLKQRPEQRIVRLTGRSRPSNSSSCLTQNANGTVSGRRQKLSVEDAEDFDKTVEFNMMIKLIHNALIVLAISFPNTEPCNN